MLRNVARCFFVGALAVGCSGKIVVAGGGTGTGASGGSGASGNPWAGSGALGAAGSPAVGGDGSGIGGSSSNPTGGTGGTLSVVTLDTTGVNKVDLLFMIDNSISMGDKQAFLQQAVPSLLSRLIVPNCVDQSNVPNGMQADANGNCAQGTAEFKPVDDIHIGVVSSSLGGRGKPCSPGSTVNPLDDDKGELVGSLRHSGTAADGTDINYNTYNNLGFLAWDANGRGANPAGQGLSDRNVLNTAFTKMVAATGEQGCGYESGLEAWYRFLVDPDPPSQIIINGSAQTEAVTNPPDGTVLQQRANFLRPDSLVAIIMISDETDCSIIDYGQGWLVAANDVPIPRATSQCATNPNDPCCRNCQQTGDAYRNCPSASSDANCSADDGDGNGAGYIGVKNNAANLRCWQTKRRFGFDLLFGIDRYVNGLTQPRVKDRQGNDRPNPLMSLVNDPTTGQPVPQYAGLSPRSDSSKIFLVGIIGVPWQDLATRDTLDSASPNLTLMNYGQMVAAQPNRWDVILGNPNPPNFAAPIPPSDPFMVESIDPRSGTNPITQQPIVSATSSDPKATINGHEYNVNPAALDDLQYACIFPLPQSRSCTDPAFTTTDPTKRRGCDCKTSGYDNVVDRNRPLCQPITGGPAGTTQFSAKAYPGTRYLQVLKSFGEKSTSQNSIVASICPKDTNWANWNNSAYGYNAAVNALVDRFKEKLGAECLAQPLPTTYDPNSGAPVITCRVIEATLTSTGQVPSCNTAGRGGEVDANLLPAVWQNLRAAGQCGVTNRPPCDLSNFTVCMLAPVPSDQLHSCQYDTATANVSGYCYIDVMPRVDPNTNATLCPTPDASDPNCQGNPALLRNCDAAHKRTLRFVSGDPNNPVPATHSTVLLVCPGP
jgi:hypothetical protein